MPFNGRMMIPSFPGPGSGPSPGPGADPETGPEAAGASPAGAESTLNGLLLAVAERRDKGAFAALFRFFAPRIKSYLMRSGCAAAEAEEVVQEVMVTLWRRADSFDPSQGGASTWVFTIARNKRIDSFRRERRPELDPADPVLVPGDPEPADRAVQAAQEAARLRAAIAMLPEEQQDLLRRAYYDDKPHSAIAEECALPLGTVKSRLRLALTRLRRELKEA